MLRWGRKNCLWGKWLISSIDMITCMILDDLYVLFLRNEFSVFVLSITSDVRVTRVCTVEFFRFRCYCEYRNKSHFICLSKCVMHYLKAFTISVCCSWFDFFMIIIIRMFTRVCVYYNPTSTVIFLYYLSFLSSSGLFTYCHTNNLMNILMYYKSLQLFEIKSYTIYLCGK